MLIPYFFKTKIIGKKKIFFLKKKKATYECQLNLTPKISGKYTF